MPTAEYFALAERVFVRRESVETHGEVHSPDVDAGHFEVEEARDSPAAHERVAERKVSMCDLLWKRRVERCRERGGPLEAGAERASRVGRESRLPHRLVQVVEKRMNARKIAVEDRGPMIELVERGKCHIELRESSGRAVEVLSAVLPQRFARYP